jgi:beclin
MATLHCQKCRTPLKIDSSLDDLNPASFKILADAAPSLDPKAPDVPRSAAARQRKQQYDEVSKDAGPPLQKRTVPSDSLSGSKLTPDMSFVMLTESQFTPGGQEEVIQTPTKKKAASKKPEPLPLPNGDQGSYSQRMETVERLFEILSSRSDIDHPICSECTELLLDGLQKRQAGVVRERDAYVEFLKKAQEDVPTDEERLKTKRMLEDAQQREQAALRELEALEAEKSMLEAEITALDAEAEELDEEEERFWQERNAFAAELTAFQRERDSLQNQVAHDTKLLESLQRTNVYNDTFAIGHDGVFGTINGLRLGRHPDHPVDWSEINAAWGQVVLLLSVVAERLDHKFKDYKLLPVGSTSRIIRYDNKQQSSGEGKPRGTTLELFSSGNLSLGLGLFHGKIDEAMVAVLDCIRQLGDHVVQTSAASSVTGGVKLPYEIHKDKIDGISIRIGNFGGDEQWTKACKFTLTCCKYLLAHASHMDDAKTTR